MNDLISVVIPVFNEKEAVEKVIKDVREVLKSGGYNYEIIAVDDGSTDGTGEILKELGIKVVRHPLTKGSGASRKTGIRSAKGGVVVMIDADGSYETKDIPEMLKCFPEYDQVIGARKKEMGTLPLLRGPVKWFIKTLAEYLAKTKIPDLNSGLRAVKTEVVKKFLWLIPDGFSCVSTMTLSFLCNGYSVKWIDTSYYSRLGKSKFHPLKDTYNYITTVIRIVMYFNPMRIFFPLGLIMFLAGVGRGIYNRYYSDAGTLQEGDIIIVVAALIFIVLGLLADLIVAQTRAQTYFSEKNNP